MIILSHTCWDVWSPWYQEILYRRESESSKEEKFLGNQVVQYQQKKKLHSPEKRCYFWEANFIYIDKH